MSKPIAWVYSTSCGTFFTEDEREILDGKDIEQWTPLCSQHELDLKNKEIQRLEALLKNEPRDAFTKRDAYAIAAMQAILTRNSMSRDALRSAAFSYADEMLSE